MTKNQKDKLDDVFRKIIRSYGCCENCGSTDNLQTAHIVTRGALQIRWNPENAFCLCKSCHFLFTTQSWRWPVFVGEKRGVELWWELHRKANKKTKLNYESILEGLQEYAKKNKIEI